MPSTARPADQAANLRKYAEEIIRKETPRVLETLETLSLEAVWLAFQELRVRQIELEKHNEELRRRQAKLAASRARYFNFMQSDPGWLSYPQRSGPDPGSESHRR